MLDLKLLIDSYDIKLAYQNLFTRNYDAKIDTCWQDKAFSSRQLWTFVRAGRTVHFFRISKRNRKWEGESESGRK